MFKKVLKTTAIVALKTTCFLLENESDEQRKKRQLDSLSDGCGGYISDDEHMTAQEAKDAQARGDLYDTYY